MALGPDRSAEYGSDQNFYMNSAAERGGVVSLVSIGSGAATDDANNLVIYASNPSGKTPIGVLMNDVVDVDLARYNLNRYKDEVVKGSKVNLRTWGEVVTNMLKSGDAPAAGDKAYLDADGRITKTLTGTVQSPRVGSFKSQKDQNGYARFAFNFLALP